MNNLSIYEYLKQHDNYAIEKNSLPIIGEKIIKANDLFKSIIEKTITQFSNDDITFIMPVAFNNCYNLERISCRNVTEIGGRAFQWCEKLTEAIFPKLEKLNGYYAFEGTNLERIELPNLKEIHAAGVFQYCNNLKALILSGDEVVDIETYGPPPLLETPIMNNTGGYVYVRDSLLEAYQDSPWADYIRPISALPESYK